jgi:hypothetical protein
MSSKPPELKLIKLKPIREKSALHFHLTFHRAPPHPSNIEFELSAHEAMCLLSGLQSVQRKNGWRVPQFRGERVGKPDLHLVKKDDG